MFLLFCTAGDLTYGPVHGQVHTLTEQKSPATLGPSIILDNSNTRQEARKSFLFFFLIVCCFYFYFLKWGLVC